MNDVFETIESYLNGSMPEEERRLFEERLKNDPELAETFRVYQGIESSMQTKPGNEEDEKALRLSLSQLGKEHFKPEPAVTRRLFTAWQAVAAIFVGAVAVVTVMWFVRHNHSQDLYNKYAKYDLVEPGVRGGGTDTLAVRAAAAYNAGEYITALPLLEKYIAKDPSDTEMLLALGVCYLERSRYGQALQVFNTISSGKTVFVNQAKWFRALTYLKQKNYEECRRALQTIPPDADVYELAKSLLNELSRAE
jgi:tetratricopeptide (TPR) repeat protein